MLTIQKNIQHPPEHTDLKSIQVSVGRLITKCALLAVNAPFTPDTGSCISREFTR